MMCVCVFFFSIQKGSYFKRKEFAPKGSKFFPFRVDTFQMGGEGIILTKLPPKKVYAEFYGPVNTVKVMLSQSVNLPLFTLFACAGLVL